ncbi:S-layer homology domain-containing protein [Paenibacillus silviterrae]|uniref:S-layer homology domain-containing protein n=1 Tax=Paenibacillus silviterrae TaxID=3242194 RepID=UPI002542F789|nr:S-layer homology domain-containing protein [Paenibacillus chinjuensis]
MRKSIVMCFIAIMLAACIPGAGYAEENTVFTLSQSTEHALPGQGLEVTVKGNHLKGLYAYEASIAFNPEIVELDKAESKLEGFFIPPKVENGIVTIAFTKVGKKAGEEGSIALSTIAFKGKAQGDANIKLVSVKALDPALKATVYSYGTTFGDLTDYEWARMEIETLASLGIIKGTSAASFSPGDNITRADFISLMVRALQLTAEVDGNFDDVEKSDYYYQEVGVAKKLGIAQGTGDNQFDPRISISRQDMMVLAARAMKMAGRMLDESDSDVSGFSDSDQVAAYAVNPLGQLVKKGIIEGYNGMIKPNDTAIRAEAAVIIYRLLNKL